MLVILPALSGLVIGLIFWRRAPLPYDTRLNLLLGWAVWAAGLTGLTELTGTLGLLSRLPLAAGWGVILLGGFALLRRAARTPQKTSPPGLLRLLPRPEALLLVGIGLIALLTLAIGLVAAPNNWDSMVYHLSRVMHWLQNQSLAFYPTHILRQLYLNPWTEYVHANLYALSGSDRFLNLVQWFSGVGVMLGVSLLARQLGAAPTGQILAAVFAVTLPMTMLQMTSTQNDLTVAFWLVCVAVFALEDLRSPSRAAQIALGICLGLAVLTKSTAYLFGFPIMTAYAIRRWRQSRAAFLRPLILVAALALLLNLPHYARNFATFGSPLGPAEETRLYRNQRFGVDVLLSNLSRNLTLHFVSVSPFNEALESAVISLHNGLKLDVNDPQTTWQDHRFALKRFVVNEDFTGAPLHVLVLMSTLVILGLRRKKLQNQEVWIHTGILLGGLLIFCGFLRWQLWHARLHLPLLILSAPIFGILPQVFPVRFSRWLGVFLLLSTLAIFYFNQNKPLVQDWNIFNLPRREVMIIRKNLVVPYIEGVNYLTGERRCTQLGLYLPDEEWEYPIWELYRAAEIGAFRIEHVLVNNRSNRLLLRPFEPCAIFATQPLPGGETVQVEGKTFRLTWEMLPVHIYTAE
ncbi:MAG: glycosyltransferase family 39 protein [Chloroflexota bacterium]